MLNVVNDRKIERERETEREKTIYNFRMKLVKTKGKKCRKTRQLHVVKKRNHNKISDYTANFNEAIWNTVHSSRRFSLNWWTLAALLIDCPSQKLRSTKLIPFLIWYSDFETIFCSTHNEQKRKQRLFNQLRTSLMYLFCHFLRVFFRLARLFQYSHCFFFSFQIVYQCQ